MDARNVLTETVQEVVELGGTQQGAHLPGIVPVQKVVQVVQLIAWVHVEAGRAYKEPNEGEEKSRTE